MDINERISRLELEQEKLLKSIRELNQRLENIQNEIDILDKDLNSLLSLIKAGKK